MTNNISTKPLKHIAIIPDGNRRWAKNQGLSPQEGHRKAFIEVAPSLLKTLWDNEIYAATLWLFSTENWKRSDSEVDNLMDVFSQFLSNLLPLSGKYSVQLRHLGRKDRLPENLLSMVEEVEHSTKGMTGHIFNFALDYGGEDEIIRAVRRLVEKGVKPEEIEPHQLMDQFCPPPDLIIRTSGECRLSGFMPLQSCYSELYFTNTFFPDLIPADIEEAIHWFQNRERRFGK